PTRPPDPRWKPDLVVLPKPPDPNWIPDLVVHDELGRDGRPTRPPDPRAARQTYVAWLRRISAESLRRDPRWRWRWFRVIGMMIFLSVVVANLWLCWSAWTYDPEKEARRGGMIQGLARRDAVSKTDPNSGSPAPGGRPSRALGAGLQP